jgi:DNA (cytosine-5)-methyltransferase 1
MSIFSGAGGLDIGFHKAGFNIVACIDIDKDSCKSLELNRGNYLSHTCQVLNADITKLDFSALHQQIGDVDFVIGGPPCQSFSAAGRRAGGVTGVNDTRGSLFWYYCKLLEKFRPSGFLFENVRGILQANKRKDWNIIQSSFSELGYTLSFRVLDAADYGVPQHRERVVLVGHKNKKFAFPQPTFGPDSPDKIAYFTSGEALADLDDPNEFVPPYGGKYGDLLPEIPPGSNYSHFTERMGHPNPRFAWRSRFSGFLYKLDPTKLSKTLVAQQGRYDGPFHWRNRKLTIPELKRIQSFPDDYHLFGSKNSQIRQIGNSVAPKFGYELAKAVMNQFFEVRFDDMNYIDDDYKMFFDKRKGIKAQKTRQKTGKRHNNRRQLSLFPSPEIEWPNHTYQLCTLPRRFSSSASLENGLWSIELQSGEIDTNPSVIHVRLDFHYPINNQFQTIDALLTTDSLWDVQILWESIHQVVNESSSYESIHPLYGHFTEPYPKFDLQLTVQNNNSGLAKLITEMSDFTFLRVLHPVRSLDRLNDENISREHFIKRLRHHGFDVRVHETNRAIPIGYWRLCYPYTLPNSMKTFTPWTQIGQHKTGDLTMLPTKTGYIPHEFNNHEQR